MNFVKKKALLVFILLGCTSSVFSQYANVEGDSLLSLGNSVYRKGNYAEAEKIYKESLEKYSSDKESRKWIIAAIGYGASLIDQGDIIEGGNWIFKADSMVSNKISLELQAYVKSNVGWATGRIKNSQEALVHYKHALDLAQQSQDEYRIAQISNSLSLLVYSLGQYSSSIEYSKIAVQSFTLLEDDFLLAMSLSNLHRSYRDLGFVEKAEEALYKALEINERIGNNDRVAEINKSMGQFYQKTGNFDKALVYFTKYLDFVNGTNNYSYIIPANTYIGSVFFDLGYYEKALIYFNRSEQLCVEHNFYSVPSTVSKIALSYQELGEFDLARSLFKKVLSDYADSGYVLRVIDTYLKLSNLELISGNTTQAKVFSEKALSLSLENESKELRAKSYAALGNVYAALSNYNASVEQHKKAYAIASIFKGYSLASYSIDLAKAFYGSKSDSSFYYANLAFSEIEREQSNIYGDNLESGLFSKYADFYDQVALWYLEKKNDANKAFEITERGRSRVLLERLSFAESNLDNILDEPTLMSIRQKEKNIDKIYRDLEKAIDPGQQEYLQAELRNAELEYQSFTNNIRLQNPSLNVLEPLPIASITDLQKKMTEKDAMIEYLVTKNKLAAFWITKSNVSYHIVDVDSVSNPQEYLSDKISDFRQAIQDQDDVAKLAQLSEPLMELLIDPYLQSSPEIDNVIIIPTQSISILPFDALYRNGEFLVERVNIKYLPSASTYNFIENPHRTDSKKILAVAGSGFNSGTSDDAMRTQDNYASLPSTLLEIDAISKEFDDYTALRNEQVTESTVKSLPLNEYRYLHFATHGNVNEQNPQQSGLIISKMNAFENSFGEDGYLNSLEISKLSLTADLVVLSACNTAIGKMVSGEGLLGLQRSFFKAGASSVIVSLWNVYDKSTSALMGEFYRKLNEYEESEIGWLNKIKIYFDIYEPPYFGYKEKALHEAKLAMLNHPYYNHPVNWAPFIMIGK
ncbi:MAG: CHAT domain-containing tetratricopeptide repeat protein [Balneola sp.]